MVSNFFLVGVFENKVNNGFHNVKLFVARLQLYCNERLFRAVDGNSALVFGNDCLNLFERGGIDIEIKHIVSAANFGDAH